MKKLFYLFVATFLTLFSVGCTDYNFVDTGTANGKHNTNMWDYFATDPYNWDSLRVMTKRADLVSLFKGTSSYGTNITFFGPTNNSIRAYLYNNDKQSIQDLTPEECKTFILNSVLPKRIMLDEFKKGLRSTNPDNVVGRGGEMFTMASGKELWIYSFQESYNNVPNVGPVSIYLVSPSTTKESHVASSNIETLTGVVHSLDYNFRLNDF